MAPFKIRLDETFPILRQAPVSEAVFEIRGRAGGAWKEDLVTAELKRLLPEYPEVESVRGMMTEVRFESGVAPASSGQDLGWLGVAMRPEGRKAAVRFQQDTFVFSRLAPYPGWADFIAEGLRLFGFHQNVVNLSEITRIGIRFINRIPVSGPIVKIDDYLVAAPRVPEELGLPYLGFFHLDTFTVPGHDYGLQVTRTIQPEMVGCAEAKSALIVDVDVFSTRVWSGSISELTVRLSEMRWLKNKAFFGSLTPQAKVLLV